MEDREAEQPTSTDDDFEAIVSSILERYRRGECPEIEEYLESHPHLAERLRGMASVFDALSRWRQDAPGLSTASPAGEKNEPPRRVLGEFSILHEVGRGGMGIVYEAEQVPLGRRVALKVLPFHSLLDTRQFERFRREVRAAARLHHTNIVPVYGMGQSDGVYYYAMQYIEGRSLDTVIRDLARGSGGEPWSSGLDAVLKGSRTDAPAEGEEETVAERFPSADLPFTEVPTVDMALPSPRSDVAAVEDGEWGGDLDDLNDLAPPGTTRSGRRDSSWAYSASVARIGLQVAEALAHAHGEGILHRDVKPSNLILDDKGNVWLTDFGLVKDEGSDNLTHTGDIIGTLAYMAPERLKGRSDARSDVYSLGVTLYELLTLRRAFREVDQAELIRLIAEKDPPPPRKLVPRIPLDLETIVLKAMAKSPADRYPSAEALAEDLRRFLDDRPIEARPISSVERAWRWCRRKPSLASLILVLLVASITVAVLLWQYHGAHEARLVAEAAARTERLLSVAQRFHAQGRYADALAAVDEILQLRPEETTARLLRCRLLFELEEIDTARAELEALARDQPSQGETHYLLARIYRDRDPARAKVHEEAAERLLVNTADAYHLRSLMAASWQESIRLLNAGLERNPGHFHCLRSRAYALYAVQDYSGAERDAYLAIGLRNLDAPSWLLRALARQKLGRLEEALSDLNRVIQLSPEDPDGYDQRRETFHLLGDHEMALEDSLACLRLDPESLIYRLNHLNALLHLGDHDALQREYEKLVGAHPESRSTIHRWLQKQVSDRFADGDRMPGLPDASRGDPYPALQAARRLSASLASKASRVVPLGSRLAWSPDGTRVAYARGNRSLNQLHGDFNPGPNPVFHRIGGIVVLDLRRGVRRLLTTSGKDPSWSPDGREIVYVQEPTVNDYRREEVWVVPVEGGEERRLCLGGFPSWTGDSRRVYFHSRTDETLRVIDANAPGAAPEVISPCPGWYPAVSPDEKLFASALGNVLQVVDIESEEAVYSWTAPEPQIGMLVQWSPDGREISIGGFDESSLGLWILDLEGLVARKVLAGPVTLGVWSPDRTQFAFDVRGAYYETWLTRLEQPSSTSNSLSYSEEVPALPLLPAAGSPSTAAEHLRYVQIVRRLEDEARRQPENALLLSRLREYRQALLPDLASYASVDAALRDARWRCLIPSGAVWKFFRGRISPAEGFDWAQPDFDADLERFGPFRRQSQGVRGRALVAYLEGRLLVRHQRFEEALSRFLEAQSVEPAVEPLLALVGAARNCGGIRVAEAELRSYLEEEADFSDARTVDLLNLWVALELVDLELPAKSVLARLPAAASDTPEPWKDHLGNLRWLLERITLRDAIFINCGGPEYRASDGRLWSRDRFYTGGYRYYGDERGGASGPFTDDIAGTVDDPLYQTERWFPSDIPGQPGYRIPLPRGEYRIRLHFAEIYHEQRGSRLFGVAVEGTEAPEAIEPLAAGYATASTVSLETHVRDGVLDIEFLPRAGDPKVSAIEIEWVD